MCTVVPESNWRPTVVEPPSVAPSTSPLMVTEDGAEPTSVRRTAPRGPATTVPLITMAPVYPELKTSVWELIPRAPVNVGALIVTFPDPANTVKKMMLLYQLSEIKNPPSMVISMSVAGVIVNRPPQMTPEG